VRSGDTLLLAHSDCLDESGYTKFANQITLSDDLQEISKKIRMTPKGDGKNWLSAYQLIHESGIAKP